MGDYTVTLILNVQADSPEAAGHDFREYLDTERRVYVVVSDDNTGITTEMDV